MLDRHTLSVIGQIMDEGTNSNGWDIGIMEAIWERVANAGLTKRCPNCGLDFCIDSNGGECPFDFCEIDEPDDEDDQLAEAGVL